MNRSFPQSSMVMASMVLAVALTALTAGCQPESVGDPCTPENIPAGGFVMRERYIETSSVQCRTRVCLVNDLNGDPTKIGCDEPGCVNQQQVDDSVYCTCRCDGPPGTADFCECPDGFTCEEILTSGGVGIQGSYCVKPKDI